MSKLLLTSFVLCIAVPFGLAACGSSDVTIGEDGTTKDSGTAPGSSTPTTPTTPPTNPTTGNDASPPRPADDAGDAARTPDGALCPTYFLDADNDGFGGTTKQVSCTPPASPDGGAWATVGGDCNDADKNVFPGQTSYFGVGYSSASGGAATSFDYDCNTLESAGPALAKAGTCTVGGDGCLGAGYLPAEPARPAGAGVDGYCGSVRFRNCRFVGGQCIPVDGAGVKAYECR